MGESGFLKSFFKGGSEDETGANPGGEGEGMNVNAPEEGRTDASNDASNDPDALRSRVIDALSEIYDPEIPVNIYELGLIYDVSVAENSDVHVIMTLTTPHCPVAESMPGEVETRVRDVAGVNDVNVELVWDPPWDMSMMSEAARLELGFM